MPKEKKKIILGSVLTCKVDTLINTDMIESVQKAISLGDLGDYWTINTNNRRYKIPLKENEDSLKQLVEALSGIKKI